MSRAARGPALVTCALLTAIVAGCGQDTERDEARAVVERFTAAVRADRGRDACAQLSVAASDQLEGQSGEPCSVAVTRLRLETGAVLGTHLYVTNAKVDLRGGQSAFLGREPRGWRLTAVGCHPVDGEPRDRPFDCELES